MNPIAATWPLLLGMGILMLGFGLQSTLLGVRASAESFSPTVTGLIMSGYYVGYVVGTRLAPRLMRQVGPIRVFATLAAISTVAALVQGMWVHPVPWALMRVFSGLCAAGIYVVAESWLNHRATSSYRGRLFAIYMLILYAGLGSAQFLLLVANPASTAPFMLVAALICAAMVPIAASAREVPGPEAPQRVRFAELYRQTPLGVVAVAIAGMISSILFSMGPVYAQLVGFDTQGVAVFMALSIVAGALSQYPVGRLSDRLDRRTVIALVCLVASVVAVLITALPARPTLAFLALASVFSAAALTLYSLSVSHVNDKLRADQMVAASGKLLLINGAAAAVGPLVVGALLGVWGARAYFGSLAALTGALTLFDLWRKLRQRPVPAAEKGPFINTHEQVTGGGLEASPPTVQ